MELSNDFLLDIVKLKKICKKHHLHKIKLAYKNEKEVVFYCKYKLFKYYRFFEFNINTKT